MRKIYTNQRLSRKEKQLIERKAEEIRLLEKYVEGESNIDSSKLNKNDILALAFSDGLFLNKKEKIIGKAIPLISKAEWL